MSLTVNLGLTTLHSFETIALNLIFMSSRIFYAIPSSLDILFAGEHYQAIKTKCCVENAIPSQCMTATVLGKPKGLMSVATKVAVQMNCKLGGEPWAVKIPLKNTMVLG